MTKNNIAQYIVLLENEGQKKPVKICARCINNKKKNCIMFTMEIAIDWAIYSCNLERYEVE